MIKENKYYGDIILILASFIWGVGYVAVAYGLIYGAGEIFLTASRFILASLFQIPFVYKKIKFINKRVVLKGVLLGILLVSGFVFQTVGQSYTTTTNVAFLTSVNIVIIPFTSMFILRKHLEFRSVIAALITFCGIGFLTLGKSFSINIGDYYVLVCAFIFAMYSSVTDKYAKQEDPHLLVFIQMLTSAFFSSIMFIFSKESIVLNKVVVISIVYLALFSNLIALILYTLGLKFTSAERGSVIVSLEGVFGAIFGILLFSEPFSYSMIIGSTLILFAIFYSEKIIFP